MTRADLTEKLLDIKREKGWSWKQICSEIGRDHRATLTFYARIALIGRGIRVEHSPRQPVSRDRVEQIADQPRNWHVAPPEPLGRSLTMSAWSISTTVGGGILPSDLPC